MKGRSNLSTLNNNKLSKTTNCIRREIRYKLPEKQYKMLVRTLEYESRKISLKLNLFAMLENWILLPNTTLSTFFTFGLVVALYCCSAGEYRVCRSNQSKVLSKSSTIISHLFNSPNVFFYVANRIGYWRSMLPQGDNE